MVPKKYILECVSEDIKKDVDNYLTNKKYHKLLRPWASTIRNWDLHKRKTLRARLRKKSITYRKKIEKTKFHVYIEDKKVVKVAKSNKRIGRSKMAFSLFLKQYDKRIKRGWIEEPLPKWAYDQIVMNATAEAI